jgi:hypothetical protein
MGLPPELDRLGDALARATAREAARRRSRAERRRRLSGSLVAGLLVFAAMTPARLERGDQADFFSLAIAPSAEAAVVCDQPRGPRFRIAETCVVRRPQPQAAR